MVNIPIKVINIPNNINSLTPNCEYILGNLILALSIGLSLNIYFI